MSEQLLSVSGVTCDHGAHALDHYLSARDAVTDVRISLVPGASCQVNVSAHHPIDSQALGSAVEEAGYEVMP